MHPDHKQLTAYALAMLPEDVAEPIAEHLRQCEECEATIAAHESAADTIIEKLRVEEPKDEFAEEAQCREMLDAIKRLTTEISSSGIEQTIDSAVPPVVRDYELFEKLGEGGMGSVYKARHRKLQRWVALKVLTAARTRDRAAIARFEREMQAVGQLSHPNIVGATDAGEAEGTHYLVMELVNGVNLSQLVRAMGPLSVADACEIIRQAAIGLDHAHRRGLVHRDVKPSNVMLARDSDNEHAATVKILDMGLALLAAGGVPTSGDLTSEGQMMGTLDYMPPEQCNDSRQVDFRADLYSLGATLYKLLSGQAPFACERFDNTLDMLAGLASQPAPPIQGHRADVPDQVAEVLTAMLAKSADARPASAGDVASALEPFCEGHDLTGLLARAVSMPGSRTTVDQSSAGIRNHGPDRASPSAQGQANEMPIPPSRGKRTWLTGMGAILLLLAAVVVIDFTNGKVIVQSADGEQLPPDLTIALAGNRGTVNLHSADGWSAAVSPGEYQIEVQGGGKAFHVDGNQITVSRFGETTLVIRRLASPNTPAAPVAQAKPGNREIAEWVIRNDGELTLRIGDPPWKYASRIEDIPTEPFDILAINIDQKDRITDAELEIVSRLPHVGQLNFANQPLTDTSVRHIAGLPKIERLYLNETQYTDEGLRQLSQIPTVSTLYLSSPNITNNGLAVLPKMTNLTALKIAGRELTPAGWNHIGAISQLVYLELYAHDAINDDLTRLANLGDLETLRLRFGNLERGGLVRLSERIPQCRILYDTGSEWIVVGNTDRYAAQYALDRGGSVDIEVMGSRSTIDEPGGLPPEDFQLVGIDLTGLQYRIAGFVGTELLGVQYLRSITLDSTQLNSEAISYLRFYPTLEAISVRGGRFHDDGLKHLHQLKKLQSLDLTGCSNITADGIRALREALPECEVVR